MAGLAGKSGRFLVGSTKVKVTRWRANLRQTALETTNSEGGGDTNAVPEEYIAGVYGGDVDADILYKLSEAQFTLLTPGASVSITLSPDKTDAAKCIAGTLYVEAFEIVAEVKGLVMGKVSGKFTGAYTVTSM